MSPQFPPSPRISVVIPAYNAESTILRAVASVLAQSFAPSEILVIDDGSTDSTAEVLRTVEAPLIRLISKENAGAGEARNEGIRQARGEWVAFLDADDMWCTNHLALLVGAIRRFPDVMFVGSIGPRRRVIDGRRMRPKGRLRGLPRRPRRTSFFAVARRFYFRRAVDMSSIAVDRQLLESESIEFPHDRVGEDIAFFCRVAACSALGWVPRVSTVTTSTSGSIMKSISYDAGTPDCRRAVLMPHYVQADEIAHDNRLPIATRREALLFRDNLIARYWPTILINRHQKCAAEVASSMTGNSTFGARAFRLSARCSDKSVVVLGAALRVVLSSAGVSTESPFSVPKIGT